MARGEGQAGKRRGPYAPRAKGGDVVPIKPSAKSKQPSPDIDPFAWDADDEAHYADLIAASPIASLRSKQFAAKRATELHRQLRLLDHRQRTVEEEKAMVSSSSQYRKWLELLKVAAKVVDDDDDDLTGDAEDEDDD